MKTKRQFFYIIICLIASMVWVNLALAAQIWDEFPLVRDNRNFKESSGGKGVPSQGRIINLPQIQKLVLNEEKFQQLPAGDKDWSYAVAMNCRRGDRSVFDIVREVEFNLISKNQDQRVGLVLGINERLTVDHPLNFMPSWADIFGTPDYLTAFSHFKIPVLLVYFQWTSFRESVNNSQLGALQVRELIAQRLHSVQNTRQNEFALHTIREQDSTHQFPFGKAREFLLENSETKSFIARLHRNNSRVYVHIQDSDFISFQEPLMFGNFQGYTPLLPANSNRLLEKFDAIIADHKSRYGRLPIIVGGAHVYNPTEDLSAYIVQQQIPPKDNLNSVSAKNWTRFASEMGNNTKHIIGQQQPYGLYFHEPNSMVLSPASAHLLGQQEQSPEWQKIYIRLSAGFHFGIDSEVQEFTRGLFKDAKDEVCRQGMVFSSTAVLSTSMKRGKKPFTIKFKGTYNEATKRFVNWTNADLSAIRGMSQEIIHPNKWCSNIATSFANHRQGDARKFICQALKLFDPIELLDSSKPQSYLSGLYNYNDTIGHRKNEIRTLYNNLRGYYNGFGKGEVIAFQIITAGWETGQLMRLMFLDHLQPPLGVIVPPITDLDQNIRIFLSTRFNLRSNLVDPTNPGNPFVAELLNLTPIVQTIKITPTIAQIITISVEKEKIVIAPSPIQESKELPKLSTAYALDTVKALGEVVPMKQHAAIATKLEMAPQAPVHRVVQLISPQFDVTQAKVASVVKYVYEVRYKNNSQTARDMGVARATVLKLMSSDAPVAWKKIAESLNTPAKVSLFFNNFRQEHKDQILQILAYGGILTSTALAG
jgi:hypothetical protein